MPRACSVCAALATLACLIIAISGCGSSGGASASTPAQFVAKADPICKELFTKRATANKSATTLAAAAKVGPALIVDEQRTIATLRALKAPQSLNGDWQRILTGMQKLAADLEQVVGYAKSKNAKEVKRIVVSARTIRRGITKIAKRHGFAYCGLAS